MLGNGTIEVVFTSGKKITLVNILYVLIEILLEGICLANQVSKWCLNLLS